MTHETDSWGLVASASLFLGSLLLSRRRRQEKQQLDHVCERCHQLLPHHPDAMLIQHPYYTHRIQERLSYENLTELAVPNTNVDDEMRSSSIDHEFDDDDFPANSNWNHFEIPSEEPSNPRDTRKTRVISLEGDWMTETRSTTSSNNREFVWTEASSLHSKSTTSLPSFAALKPPSSAKLPSKSKSVSSLKSLPSNGGELVSSSLGTSSPLTSSEGSKSGHGVGSTKLWSTETSFASLPDSLPTVQETMSEDLETSAELQSERTMVNGGEMPIEGTPVSLQKTVKTGTESSRTVTKPRGLSRAESLDDRTLYFKDAFNIAGSVLPSSGSTDDLFGLKPRGASPSTTSRKDAQSSLYRRSNSQPDLHSLERYSIRAFERSLSDVVRRQNRVARSSYNRRIMPNRVIMVRHGQSIGNIDEKLYSTIPDNAMPLTKLGWEQARAAGKHLKNHVLKDAETVHFVVSPYVRTVETFHGIVSAWCDPAEFSHIGDREVRLKAWYSRLLELGLTWHEDPRIREQDFGNYQDSEAIKHAKRERHHFGAFYYRFPYGESASDVFDRISTFLDSLWRSFDLNKSRNYVIVTHGISIRVLLARYFRYTIDQFNLLANPRNCEMVVLRHDGEGRLQLDGRHELDLEEDRKTGEKHVVGCTYHRRLKVLPQDKIRKVKIRISFDD